jgi:putative spermidine/putrescine transport system permease protein
MTDATANAAAPTGKPGPMIAADGRPLKRSLARALRRQKLRALMLIAPLLIFILVTFIAPIVDMLFRSVENEIVSNTIPRTVEALDEWSYASGEMPPEAVYEGLYYDLFAAVEGKTHTRLGSRLNYETTGVSSLFRQVGRALDDVGEDLVDAVDDADPAFEDSAFWASVFLTGDSDAANRDLLADVRARTSGIVNQSVRLPPDTYLSAAAVEMLPKTAAEYAAFAMFTNSADGDVPAEEDPWESVRLSLAREMAAEGFGERLAAYAGPGKAEFTTLAAVLPPEAATFSFRDAFLAEDDDWGSVDIWGTIKAFGPVYTSGYFLSAADRELTPVGVERMPENERIYAQLFWRTMVMSLTITLSCILLGYPIAWLLANLPLRSANVLMILVLLPFWTSLLVRTSAWKVLLQQQGVINDVLVWLNFVDTDSRLILINNVTGTVIAMTHILLPFMILPLYSVMKTIPPSYLRAAKSLGATNWTAFWRVYFPQSVPGIGAGSILVFILAIGYYITPEIVGGTKGVFISNRIAYHISTSLNWGLAAALGTILLVLVLTLYWVYDRIVGIDNVKLGG